MNNTEVLAYLALASLVLFFVSLLLVPWICVRIPGDYFLDDQKGKQNRHPVLTTSILILRNMVGLILFVLGLIMLFTPGQGLLTIFLSLLFMTIPGKQKLLLRIVRQPQVYRIINRLRERAGKRKLSLPAKHSGLHASSKAKG